MKFNIFQRNGVVIVKKPQNYFLPARILGISILILFSVASCFQVSPEQQILLQIDELQRAISNKKLTKFFNVIAKDFSGNKQMTREQLRYLIYYQFSQNRNINIVILNKEIEIFDNKATVNINFIITGSEALLPEKAGVYTIQSDWQKFQSDWYVINARWQDAVQKYLQ